MPGETQWGEDWTSGAAGGGERASNANACFRCGKDGHRKSECPEPEKENACYKCGQVGHRKSECPDAGEDDNKCFNCGESGHKSSDCEKPVTCRNCGKEGHKSSDCEKPVTCRKCGEEGHKSNDCQTGFKTRNFEKEDGTKVEVYVPVELPDDKLFAGGISSGINFDKFDAIEVRLTGNPKIPPIAAFGEANLRSLLMDNIGRSGYVKPTPVQKSAIPIIMGNRDLMACAQTGSGKTAAFLLPILHSILERGDHSSAGECPQKPTAVIVAPTRELANQIKDEARKFAKGSVVNPCVVYGGTSIGYQLKKVFDGTDILIATPGRLLDFVEKGKISFDNVRYLVLDEADRMLDMGFLPDIQRISSAGGMPPKGERQTLMFSATFPEEVQQLAKEFLENYLFLTIGIVGGANSDVEQSFFQVDKFAKREKLQEILDTVGSDRTLVFVATKKNADFLASFLSDNGYPTTSIHGDRQQREREEALSEFKTGNKPILIATAVAARGLDIKGVKHVINYDLPNTIDEYVHRIGRTGRVGNTGIATSFYDSAHDASLVSDLVRTLKDCHVDVPEWLASESGDGAEANFGGQDIREDEDENWN